MQCPGLVHAQRLYVFDSQGPVALLGETISADEFTWDLTGVVSEQGQGFPSDAAPSGAPLPEHPEQFRYLRVSASGHRWTVAMRDVKGFGVRDGAQVDLHLAYEWGGFSPEQRALSIRVDGQLAFFYGLGGEVASLPIPSELRVAQGAALCRTDGECGSWSSFQLEVAEASATAEQVLAPGESKQVGPYEVTHDGDDQQVPGVGDRGCADWFVSRSELLVVRREALSSATGSCSVGGSSSLDGVHIDFPADVPCRFTRAQAAAGIAIPYALVIDADVPRVTRETSGIANCYPVTDDLFTFEELSGNQQRYAIEDVGLCAPMNPQPMTLSAGRHEHTFDWDGVNWSGPSDTGVPKGPPFPAGVYTLRVRAAGTTTSSGGGAMRPFEVIRTLEITLVP
jgi:hypothetical protein